MEMKEKDTLIGSLWYGLNYGSILSAFALYKTVEKIGHHPVLLRKPEELWTDHYDDPENIAGKFIYKNCDVMEGEQEKDQAEKMSFFLAGPDVIWNYNLCGSQTGDYFFGGFLKDDIKRISCASSFGKVQGDEWSQEEQLKTKRNLEKFAGISVRGGYDADICQSMFGVQSEIILDPVFLCDISDYEEVIRTAHYDAVRPYIFTYIERGNERIKKYIEEGMRVKSLDSRNYIDINRFPESSKELGLEVTFHVMADDWLCSIWNSDFVVTDSYYGMCFAILFRKPFAVITSPDFKRRNEVEELLSWLGLEERMVPCDEFSDLKDYVYLFRKGINYERADRRLKKLQEESLEWLKNQMGSQENTK